MALRVKIDPDHSLAVLPNALNTGKLSVLVVDDDETNCSVLEIMLRSDGHDVHIARNGSEAVSVFKSMKPDLVLMDIMMPVMNGYDATQKIKSMAGDHFVPVIFITALADEQVLAKCLEVGGDDFITKPLSRVILRAKLAAAARIHGLYSRLERQQEDLKVHHERLRYEHDIAEQVFAKIVGNARAGAPNIKSELLPMAITNGDLLLIARTPVGGQCILLGDCTGHGLSAAIGAIPVTDIFYAMTHKGFGLRDIVLEMNRKLRATLPTGQFLAAGMVEWDPRDDKISVWNGGLPDALLVASTGDTLIRMPSHNLPLGIVDNAAMEINISTQKINSGDMLYLYSDGLIDAPNRSGAMFSQERLEEVIRNNADRDSLFDELRNAVAAFRDGQVQNDDMSLVEVLFDKEMLPRGQVTVKPLQRNSAFKFSLRLGPEALEDFDPLNLVDMITSSAADLERHRSHLYTILMELYTNSLEHGVLRMDCKLKETEEGFGKYYAERERLLSELKEGWIQIFVEYCGDNACGELILRLEDSGKGFATAAEAQTDADDQRIRFGGRGLKLVLSLCKSLSLDEQGNSVTAVYAW